MSLLAECCAIMILCRPVELALLWRRRRLRRQQQQQQQQTGQQLQQIGHDKRWLEWPLRSAKALQRQLQPATCLLPVALLDSRALRACGQSTTVGAGADASAAASTAAGPARHPSRAPAGQPASSKQARQGDRRRDRRPSHSRTQWAIFYAKHTASLYKRSCAPPARAEPSRARPTDCAPSHLATLARRPPIRPLLASPARPGQFD